MLPSLLLSALSITGSFVAVLAKRQTYHGCGNANPSADLAAAAQAIAHNIESQTSSAVNALAQAVKVEAQIKNALAAYSPIVVKTYFHVLVSSMK